MSTIKFSRSVFRASPDTLWWEDYLESLKSTKSQEQYQKDHDECQYASFAITSGYDGIVDMHHGIAGNELYNRFESTVDDFISFVLAERSDSVVVSQLDQCEQYYYSQNAKIVWTVVKVTDGVEETLYSNENVPPNWQELVASLS